MVVAYRILMPLGIGRLKALVARILPEDRPGRKLLRIVSAILIVEGLFVLALFSYLWVGLGVASFTIGVVLMLLLAPSAPRKAVPEEPIGIALTDRVVRAIGGEYVMIALGGLVIALVLVFDLLVSARPGLGDFDTISIAFGATMIAYPFLSSKYRSEAVFSLLFVGFVVVFLVVPQAVTSLSESSDSSSLGNWYVHYMLAAPFAGILDLIGIPASSSGNMVTVAFKDGTIQMLSISVYCAGLYSFSIFLSAFLSFVLVFERMKRTALLIVLLLGLLVAYLGNLFRMVVIGVVGYHYGLDALLWAHENAGWIIFLSWSAVFWWLILRFMSSGEREDKTETSSSQEEAY